MKHLLTFLRDESGQSMAEYGLLLALIAIACVLVLTGLGTSVVGIFSKIKTALDTASAKVP